MSKLSLFKQFYAKYYQYIIGFVIGLVFSYWVNTNDGSDFITPELIKQTLNEEVLNDSINTIIDAKSNEFNTNTATGRDSIDSVVNRIRTRANQ